MMRFRKTNTGFSLIEMMVVVAIIAALLGMVLVNMDSLVPSSRLQASAREMGSTISLAINQAAILGKFTIIHYDIDQGLHKILIPPEDSTKANRDFDINVDIKSYESLSPTKLRSGVKIKDIDIAGDRTYRSTFVNLSISPLRTVPGHVIHLVNEEDQEVTIEVNPLSGIVTIKDGYHKMGFIEEVK